MGVLIIGSTALDDIETTEDKAFGVVGGSAFYAAIATNFFTKPYILGRVGNDFPDEYLIKFESLGIDLEGVQKGEDKKTFHWYGKYLENFDDRVTISLDLGTWIDFSVKIPERYFEEDINVVFLANIDPKFQLEVYNKFKDKGAFFILDTMNFYIENFRDELNKVIPKVNLFIINEEEYKLLTGEKNIYLAFEKLFLMYDSSSLKYIVIKKGSHGSILMSKKGELFILPAYPIKEVKDPTGAGDSFAGALAGYLSKLNDFSFLSIKKGLLYATVVSSFTIEDFSIDRLLNISFNDINQRVENLKNYISI